MTAEERWAKNENVNLHYLDCDHSDALLTPLLHIPGAFGPAESFLKDMKSLSPRRCVSISLRGRGKSDIPEHGYQFKNLVSDIEAVVRDSNLDSMFIYAFSLGVPPALGYAVKYPEKIKGIVIGDYGACYLKQPVEWTEKFKQYPTLVNYTAVIGT